MTQPDSNADGHDTHRPHRPPHTTFPAILFVLPSIVMLALLLVLPRGQGSCAPCNRVRGGDSTTTVGPSGTMIWRGWR